MFYFHSKNIPSTELQGYTLLKNMIYMVSLKNIITNGKESLPKKEGIRFSHISAWENEPHDAPNTPTAFKVETEPHHHHYVPGERKYRKENYDVRTLEADFEFVAHFITSGEEYTL